MTLKTKLLLQEAIKSLEARQEAMAAIHDKLTEEERRRYERDGVSLFALRAIRDAEIGDRRNLQAFIY